MAAGALAAAGFLGAGAAYAATSAGPATSSPDVDGDTCGFPDVHQGDLFCDTIRWMHDQHLAFGYPDGDY